MSDTPYAASFGYSLAMAVLQSDLYRCLDDHMRAECDELIARGQGRAALAAPAAVEREALTDEERGDLQAGACVFLCPPYDKNPASRRIATLMNRLATATVKQTPYGPAIRGDVLIDAERYRFLRRCRGQEHDPLFTVLHELDGTLWGGDLDAAIDAASQETEE